MVLEQILIKDLRKKSFSLYFFLAFIYFILAYLFAIVIFPNTAGLMTISILSMMLIPTIVKLISIEESRLIREKKLSLKGLWEDNKDIINIYIAVFLGTFFANLLVVFLSPIETAQHFFTFQLNAAGFVGHANLSSPKYFSLFNLFFHNLIVLFVAFLLSFFYGAGVIFILWNASVWATSFAMVAKISTTSTLSLTALFNTLLPSFPHLVLESLSYILASLTGGVLSKAVIQEDLFSLRFKHIFTDSLIFLLFSIVILALAAILEYRLFL